MNALNGLSTKKSSPVAELKRQGWDSIDLMNLILEEPRNQTESADGRELAELGQSTAEPESESERQTVANFSVEIVDGRETCVAKPIDQIVDEITRVTGGWPKVVEGELFAEEDSRTHRLHKSDAFFGWLQSKASLNWLGLQGCVTKKECFERIGQRAEWFGAATNRPHREPLEGVFYTSEAKGIEAKATGLLDKLVGMFSPDSELDRELIRASFVTPCWDGPPGKRPLFVITANGTGSGKSTLAKLVSELWGKYYEATPNQQMDTIKTRLLSRLPELVRVGVIDNVKKHRFSWPEFEGLLTAPMINGRKDFCGDKSMPNYLTWFLTLNSPSFDRDLSVRSAVIKLRRPKYDPSWETTVSRFISENRIGILQDCLAFFRLPVANIKCGRFGEWDREIIGRLRDPERLIELLTERRQDIDETERDAKAIVQAAEAIRGRDDSSLIPAQELVGKLNEKAGSNAWDAKTLKATIEQLRAEDEKFPLKFKKTNSANGYCWVDIPNF
jgi:hypothetical protein